MQYKLKKEMAMKATTEVLAMDLWRLATTT
jgi:hypothetical protein